MGLSLREMAIIERAKGQSSESNSSNCNYNEEIKFIQEYLEGTIKSITERREKTPVELFTCTSLRPITRLSVEEFVANDFKESYVKFKCILRGIDNLQANIKYTNCLFMEMSEVRCRVFSSILNEESQIESNDKKEFIKRMMGKYEERLPEMNIEMRKYINSVESDLQSISNARDKSFSSNVRNSDFVSDIKSKRSFNVANLTREDRENIKKEFHDTDALAHGGISLSFDDIFEM